jgi:sortase A
VGTPLIPQRSLLQPPHAPARNTGNQAAANIVRGQLNSIYDGNTSTPTPQTTPVATESQSPVPEAQLTKNTLASNPIYGRTHDEATGVQVDQWKHYHSAWQDYYQKYYERYYIGQVYQAQQALEARVTKATTEPKTEANEPRQPESLTRDEAIYDLRGKLLTNLRNSAKKVRKSRHFIPITAAVCVMFVFLFLQYNRILFANVEAYISPGNIDPANIIVDPSTDVAVSNDPKLIIPKINVDVPADYNAKPDYDSQMASMQNGVAYFGIPGADSKPGQIGNTVLSGHSSNDIIDQGSYKFIFARLDQLNNGDTIYLNYNGKRYMYTVTKKQIVKPTNVSALVYKTDKPILTLITCTPLGTSLNRLLVTAEQVSPDPKNALPAPEDSASSSTATSIPGASPTIVERLFGGNGN